MALATVAASQTDAAIGTGEAFIKHLLIVPETVSPGAVTLKDGATSYALFAGGTNSVATVHGWVVPIESESINGGWTITTGANVHVIIMS